MKTKYVFTFFPTKSLLIALQGKKMLKLLLAFFLATNVLSLWGQAITQTIGIDALNDFIPLHSDKIVTAEILPEVDVEAALAEDILNGIEIPRFAVKIPTFFTKIDGDLEIRGSKTIWKAAFKSVGAISLNFQFTDLALPDGSQLFIYKSCSSLSC